MCHNVIEAMSVGTIPLLEYPERFSPALADGENAICFSGLDGLADALDRIDNIGEQQRTRMQESVAAYYDKYLRGDRFLAALRDGATVPSDGMISMPFNDKNFFAKSLPAAA